MKLRWIWSESMSNSGTVGMDDGEVRLVSGGRKVVGDGRYAGKRPWTVVLTLQLHQNSLGSLFEWRLSGPIQWCPRKCLTTGSLETSLWFVAVADFHGMNAPTAANLKRLVGIIKCGAKRRSAAPCHRRSLSSVHPHLMQITSRA